MTPEEVRRILDPERRRAGFEAWNAEQREALQASSEAEGGTVQWTSTPPVEPLHTGRVGDSGGTCASKGLDDVGQPQPAAARPGEAESLSGFAAWLPTPEQTRRFWGNDPMGPRRELADEMQRQRDAAEAEMREALGKLVAQRISSKVECESVMQTTDGAFEVHLAVDACDYDWHLSEPPQGEFKLSWERCPHRYAWQATARIPVAGAAQVLRDALGDEALAALQPKLEVRDGVATITRKTLRKDGGG